MGLAGGGLLATLWERPWVGSRGAGQIAWWIASRALGRGPEGGALLGLDRGGLVAGVWSLPPVRAVAARAGRLWTLLDDGHSWWLAEPWGRPIRQPKAVEPGTRLALDRQGDPWLLGPEQHGQEQLRGPDGRARLVTSGALDPVPSAAGVALGNRAGELFDCSPAGVWRRDSGVRLLGLYGDGGRLCWAGIDAAGRLLVSGNGAGTRALRGPGSPGEGCLLAPGGRGVVWVSRERQLQRMADPPGRTIPLSEPPTQLQPDGCGGVWVLHSDFLQRFSAEARPMPGQGGLWGATGMAPSAFTDTT